mmetsp:Transcript_300/g.602  ORF Transcript_300/g.602 Transcript_300/m.602 type:complete len:161 (-) Transcript_300:311-793(-)
MGVNATPDEETGHGSAPSMQQVKGEIQHSIAVMQENMRAMAVRESQLLNLDEKSAALNGVSTVFQRGAKRLYQQQMWQRYKFFVALVCTITWAACVVMFRNHLKALIMFTALAAVVAWIASHYLWQSPVNDLNLDEEKTQLVRAPQESIDEYDDISRSTS